MKMGEDIMNSIVEMLLTGLIDPLIWMKSMSTLGVRKNRKQCILIFLIYYSLIVGKGIWERYNRGDIVRECAMFLILLYAIFATWYLFEGTFHEKMIHILMFYCILIITELFIFQAYSLLHPEDMDGALNDSISKFVCGCLVKMLQGLLCYCFFGNEKTMKFFYHNIERLSLILICFAMLSNLYFVKYVNEESSKTILLFETALLLLIWFVLSSMFALKGKNKHIWELKQKANSSLGTPRQVSDIDQFRHDFSTSVFLMKNLWNYKEYDKLEHYMNTAFADVEKVKLLYEHPNFPVRIVVSSLIHTAASAGIPFTVKIEVYKFGMTDEDICTVFQNLVLNGLDQASVIPAKKAYVQLEALHNDTGYAIRCRSACTREESRQQNDRKKTESIAFGMELVDRIIEKYGGIVEKKKGKSQWKNIYEREVMIQISYK